LLANDTKTQNWIQSALSASMDSHFELVIKLIDRATATSEQKEPSELALSHMDDLIKVLDVLKSRVTGASSLNADPDAGPLRPVTLRKNSLKRKKNIHS
jgi:hypothetical protein